MSKLENSPLKPELAARLAQKLRDGQLALFVGAGISHLATARDGSGRQLPLWKELAEKVARACQENPLDYSNDPLDLFDAIVYSQDRFTLKQAVKDALDDGSFELSPAHLALKELPWTAVLTTNYDGLLSRLWDEEPVFEEEGYDHLKLPEAKRPRLFQIHGTLNKPHTLTKEDYRM